MVHLDMPLIDIHTHIGHLPGVLHEAFTAEDLCYIATQEGARFMLTSSASTSTIHQTYGTDEALATCKAHPNLLGGMLWVNPRDPAWRTDVARAAGAGFYGLKIHPPLDHYAVDRAALDEVFACAQEHHWPILSHADIDGTPMASACYEPLLQAFPDVILILAHLRLGAIPLAKCYENLYLDTTYVDALMVEIGLDVLGPRKLLFGSDAAEGFDVGHATARPRPHRSYAEIMASYRARGIADADLEKIVYENARALFRIQEV